MASLNRTQKIKQLQKLLQKRYKHVPPVPARTVLEHLIYAALLENSSVEVADAAFAVLEHHYIDWNEVRVSTANELASTFPQLSNAMEAGDRIRKTLQAVFETTYMFDLENLRKKNLSHAIDYLESIAVCSRFMIDYTVQNGLGGHVIPLGEASLRIFRFLGLTQVNKAQTKEEVPALERAIAKQEGIAFAMSLHCLGIEHYADTEQKALQKILVSLDPHVLKRDAIAPELIVVKPGKPVVLATPKMPLPPMTIPPSDMEDDFPAEEMVETEEVEFIPNPITGEEITYDSLILEEEEDENLRPMKTRKSKEKTKKHQTEKTVKKEPVKKFEKPEKTAKVVNPKTEKLSLLPDSKEKRSSKKIKKDEVTKETVTKRAMLKKIAELKTGKKAKKQVDQPVLKPVKKAQKSSKQSVGNEKQTVSSKSIRKKVSETKETRVTRKTGKKDKPIERKVSSSPTQALRKKKPK